MDAASPLTTESQEINAIHLRVIARWWPKIDSLDEQERLKARAVIDAYLGDAPAVNHSVARNGRRI